MDTVTSTPIATKRCTKCGQEKPITEFCKKKNAPDGHNYTCKECISKYHKQWYAQKMASKRSEPTAYTSNPEFADKTPRELIASVKALITELRARGFEYEGRLTYLQTIAL